MEVLWLFIHQANVVCRQLGFPLGAVSGNCCSYFGRPPLGANIPFSYDDVRCSGNEANLDNCHHANTNDCGPEEVAGVVCRV